MKSLRVFSLLLALCVSLFAADAPPPAPPPPDQFMADYARILLAKDREALIRLYSPRGSLVIGDGFDDFSSLEQTASLYRNQWTGPTAFAWRDLSYRRIHPEVVIVSGGFDWTSPEFPAGARFDYSAILVWEEGKWRIRSEVEVQKKDTQERKADPDGALGITRPTSVPCVFCEIVAGTRQQESVVYRDGTVVAFLSIGARNPGHVLIVPAAHADNFLEVPDATMQAMTIAAKKIIGAIKRTDLRMEGFQLHMSNGRAGGQSVFHAHLHVIPRFTGDAPAPTGIDEARLRTGQAETAPPPKREGDPFPQAVLAPVAAKIRAALGASPVGAVLAPTDSREVAASGAPTFKLPELGEEVPLPKIKEICAHYGLHALWAKIEKDPPPRPFKSDGCTGWFDDWRGVSLYPAGFLHDLKYWAGYPGEDVERLVADAELMTDVARLLKSTTMAETMFHGVRVGGTEQLQTSFSWGFGRAK